MRELLSFYRNHDEHESKTAPVAQRDCIYHCRDCVSESLGHCSTPATRWKTRTPTAHARSTPWTPIQRETASLIDMASLPNPVLANDTNNADHHERPPGQSHEQHEGKLEQRVSHRGPQWYARSRTVATAQARKPSAMPWYL